MEATEHFFKSWDGTDLFYRSWLPPRRAGKALLLFHRGHEHSGRWQETVQALGLTDIAVFAGDARGHGLSPGERGAARNGYDVVRDVDAFARHIVAQHGIALENTIVLAHSLAAVNVAAWVHDYAPPLRAMILATAAFRVKLYVPLALPALRFKQKLFGPGFIKSYVKSGMLTHDPAEAARYDADPLIFRQIAVNVLLDLENTAKRLIADAGAIRTPTLMLGAGRDWVVSLEAQREFFSRISSREKKLHIFPEMRHALFHEEGRAAVIDQIRTFINDRFAISAAQPSLMTADREGHTWREYERLKANGHAKFALARATLRVFGRLSSGVAVGFRSGFDSGLSLDYVYKNQPDGVTAIGRLIDKAYLNSIGWRGIRQRKIHLEKALRQAIEEVRQSERPIHIVDIAAGPGRYLLETIRRMPQFAMSALLRDYRLENVEAARVLADEFKLSGVKAEAGDAFDRASLGSITPRATIGIASGIYELFPSNEDVLKSLGGLAEAIEPEGYLIYTNQPWHPQVEFIAGVLRNREGEPWVMRRRTTAEMDELVRISGFEKIAMDVDHWGMFTVSIARRVAA